MSSNPELFVVIGDVHGLVKLALTALAEIEQEQGRKIAQVFSVGDFGLFLSESDWDFFTGPARHKHPDWSPEIRKAWTRWQWPLAMIGGNHEPWHRLRVFDSGHFGDKLSYTNGGVLPHNLSGLMVVGLSGIQRPWNKVYFAEPAWQETLTQCQFGKMSRRELTFYRSQDVIAAANAGPAHTLLTHDWPSDPDTGHPVVDRPEWWIASAVGPKFHFSGHHHRSAAFAIERTEVRALNIIADNARQDIPKPGWAWLGTWDGETLREIGLWPQANVRARSVR